MQRITNCLWFDGQAEEAANFYTSIFKNSKILDVVRYTENSSKASGQPVGDVMTVTFELDGQKFLALNGGSHYKFTPAISLMVACETQAELDNMWDKLTDGGGPVQCGWLTDKFGVSWQVIPNMLDKLLVSRDEERTDRVLAAVTSMIKLDIDTMQKAYDGK